MIDVHVTRFQEIEVVVEMMEECERWLAKHMQQSKRQYHMLNWIGRKKHVGSEPLKLRACSMESKESRSDMFVPGNLESLLPRQYLQRALLWSFMGFHVKL